MIRKSINKLFAALLVILLSIALIGCEASPKKNSADGGNTPPPVEEDPKEKFIGKWFYEVEDEVYVVEITPYGSGLMYKYSEGMLESAPYGFTYEVDKNVIELACVNMDLNRMDPEESEDYITTVSLVFDAATGTLVLDDVTIVESTIVLKSMNKEDADLSLDKNIFGKWLIADDDFDGVNTMEMTPSGHIMLNIGETSGLFEYSTKDGVLSYADANISYAITDGILQLSIGEATVLNLEKIVALNENNLVGTYVSSTEVVNITNTGLYVSGSSESDNFDVEVIIDITENEIYRLSWDYTDDCLSLGCISYIEDALVEGKDENDEVYEKSDVDILVPTVLVGGIGFLDKDYRVVVFNFRSIYDEHLIEDHIGGCPCEGSIVTFFSNAFGLDSNIIKPIENAENIVMFAADSEDEELEMGILGYYEVSGDNIKFYFCTKTGVVEAEAKMTFVPVGGMFYLSEGESNVLFVTTGA